MYTFSPVSDLTSYHYGWYVYCVVAIFVLYKVWQACITDREYGIASFATFVIGALAFGIYDGSYNDVAPTNTQVVAEFEGFTHQQKESGDLKHKSYTDVSYANFKLPNGHIAIKVNSLQSPIPDRVILYWNDPKKCGGCS